MQKYSGCLGRITRLLSVVVTLKPHRSSNGRVIFRAAWTKLGRRTGKVRPKTSRLDDCDLYAEWSDLFCQRFGKALNAKLCRCVGSTSYRPQASSNRRNLDNMSRLALTEVWKDGLGHDDHAEEIGLDLSTNIVEWRIFHWRNVSVTRVVDEHVQAAEVLNCRVYGGLSLHFLSDVERDRKNLFPEPVPQIGELIDLARAFPDTPIVMDHVGTPVGIGAYAGRREERFPIWREKIFELAESSNVMVKLGGLAMPFCGFPSFMAAPPAPSTQLAAEWKPYLETCIEAFGVDRGMFESNFPVQKRWSSYAVTWNGFKRIAAGASAAEKAALFAGTAARVYGVR